MKKYVFGNEEIEYRCCINVSYQAWVNNSVFELITEPCWLRFSTLEQN